MAVAPSFVNFEFLSEPYLLNGKMYIRVRNPRTGTERQVRWYSEGKQAPTKTAEKVQDYFYSPQKNSLGFEKGYITIFKGSIELCEDWFKASSARYTRIWGWYFVSTDPIPADLPKNITPIQLSWELVGDENGKLYPEDRVQQAVENLVYADHPSNYIGSIGDRIEITITVVKAIETETKYGRSTMHVMEDADKNVYVWTTTSKSWGEGSVKTIKGSVKEHKTYKGVKQSILTRCLEI